MRVKVINHKSGVQLPILLDGSGFPITLPNEFILSRRALSINTQVRNLRELLILYRWLNKKGYDLSTKLLGKDFFTEADLKGGLVESLRFDQTNGKRRANTPNTFNQRLTTIRQFLAWYLDIMISQTAWSTEEYDYYQDRKRFVLNTLGSSFISSPPSRRNIKKGLTEIEAQFLMDLIHPINANGFGREAAIKYRNYVSVGLMLFCGLRPGELLSLRVEDIKIGAISAVHVERRKQDPKDLRKPRPQIKRNGRIIPIENLEFITVLDDYIVTWREVLEDRSETESEYLILSDKGSPLSLPSITQFFQLLREHYPDDLPFNLTAKSLRHTFSSQLEKVLRSLGLEEQRRREALALLRGDSSLSSQDTYIAQEVEEQAMLSLANYQTKILSERG
ncbi:MAG: site-specific integrase [Crenarchaeota archaeon]|nr:site-specific integrase [Thermoproteota archaeon]